MQYHIVNTFWLHPLSVLRTCDGVILSTSESYEPEAVESVKDWFAEDSRSVFTLGPLLPLLHDSRAATTEMKVSAKSNEIEKFLENVLASHGAKSMLYVWNPFYCHSIFDLFTG